MAVSNPLIAIILAISMLLSAGGAGNEMELPKATVTLTNQAGETITLGSVQTENGLPALFFDILGSGMTITGDAAYLKNGQAVYAFRTAEAFQAIAAMAQTLSTPLSEEEMGVLQKLGEGIVKGISPEACRISLAQGGLKAEIDVDKLAHELHMAVPVALLQHGVYVDPILDRYTTALFGQKISCMHLAEKWLQLGLDTVQTGAKIHLQLQWAGENLVISGSACDIRFQATVNANRLYFSVITPDGVSYQMDTDDFGLLLSIFASLPASVTEDAFRITQEQGKIVEEGLMDAKAFAEEGEIKPVEHDAYITTIDWDLGALARDLNQGMADALTKNKAVLDMLINKYRCWFALMDEEMAAQLSADALIEIAQMGVFELPEEKGQLKVTVTPAFGVQTTVEGHFFGCELEGKITENPVLRGEFVLREADESDPVEIKLEYSAESQGYDQAISARLSSNEKILDLFRSMNFALTTERYMTSWKLTTDTDVLHAAYSDEETYLEAKIGAFSAHLDMDENDAVHCGFSLPEFFVDLHAADNNFSLDSSVLGLDYAEDYDGFVLNGYLCEDGDSEDRLCFGLSSGDNGLDAYIKDNWNVDMAFSGSANGITFRNGRDVYTLMPDYWYAAEKMLELKKEDPYGDHFVVNNRMLLLHNGQIESLIETVEEGAKISLLFYEGIDTTVAPVVTLTIDFDPDPIALPDAIPVDMDQFLVKLGEYFQ